MQSQGKTNTDEKSRDQKFPDEKIADRTTSAAAPAAAPRPNDNFNEKDIEAALRASLVTFEHEQKKPAQPKSSSGITFSLMGSLSPDHKDEDPIKPASSTIFVPAPTKDHLKKEREELAMACAGSAADLIAIADACMNGNEKDTESGLRYFKMAAECKDDPLASAAAQNYLGDCHNFGWHDLKKDEKTALAYYKTAADQQLPAALFNVADCYLNGVGVERDAKLAVPYLEKAIAHKNIIAMNVLGWLSQYGIGGVPVNEKQALQLFQQATDLGDDMAAFNLGWCYENGLCGLKEDKRFAMTLYGTAVMKGNPHACCHLLWHDANGTALPTYIVRLSAMKQLDLGDEFALDINSYLNGLRHEYGYCGVTKDIEKAKHFYSQGRKGSNAQMCLEALNKIEKAAAHAPADSKAVTSSTAAAVAVMTSGAVTTTVFSSTKEDDQDPQVAEAIRLSLKNS